MGTAWEVLVIAMVVLGSGAACAAGMWMGRQGRWGLAVGYGAPVVVALAIGMTPNSSTAAQPPSFSAEDQEVVEERLRSLGYL